MFRNLGEKNLRTILIITCGTGGHIFPALAVGDALRSLGMNPIYVVRRNIKDINLVKQHDFQYMTIPASGFFGKNIKGIFIFFLNFLRTMTLFPEIMIKVKPEAIIASGGFTSFVPALWVIISQKKFFLLEQNRIPGRFTKYFSRWAREVYLGLPLLKRIGGNMLYTGNPLRKEILNGDRQDNGKTILVFGGSQGAKFINLNAVELAVQMPDLQFIIQTGQRDYNFIKQLVKSNNCELIDFTLSPENLYKRATIVISRAGGMVLSEILLFGIPSIIIPFPFATDNHQAANAQFLAQNSAAIILDQGRQHGLSQEFIIKLKETLRSLINNKEQLEQMSKNAKAIAKGNAATIIAQRVIKCLEN
jgi:UDP-N-acetylglucosamine--N-acetylmuramyl-(pentapeptide) pyrophosphoryl-undecaprenol N-acetylglucosamine transferase